MAPSAQSDGQFVGFMKGFKLQDQNWFTDFLKSEWNDFAFERDLNKERFQNGYLEEYEKGRRQRQRIQNEIQIKLGEITNQDKIIQDEFLNQTFDSFYGAASLFKTWEKRLKKEIFPKSEKANSLEDLKDRAIDSIEDKSYQKSLKYLKELFIKKGNSKLFHRSLKTDLELQRIRLKSKRKKISKKDYQIELLKIENQLLEIKKEIENKNGM